MVFTHLDELYNSSENFLRETNPDFADCEEDYQKETIMSKVNEVY